MPENTVKILALVLQTRKNVVVMMGKILLFFFGFSLTIFSFQGLSATEFQTIVLHPCEDVDLAMNLNSGIGDGASGERKSASPADIYSVAMNELVQLETALSDSGFEYLTDLYLTYRGSNGRIQSETPLDSTVLLKSSLSSTNIRHYVWENIEAIDRGGLFRLSVETENYDQIVCANVYIRDEIVDLLSPPNNEELHRFYELGTVTGSPIDLEGDGSASNPHSEAVLGAPLNNSTNNGVSAGSCSANPSSKAPMLLLIAIALVFGISYRRAHKLHFGIFGLFK